MQICVATDTEIQEMLQSIARILVKRNRADVFVPIMNAAMTFTSDLLRHVHPQLNPVVVPIKLKRVPRQSDTNKFVVLKQNVHMEHALRDKNIVVLDTVCDTGETLRTAIEVLRDKQPKTITTCCLLWRGRPDAVTAPDIYGHRMRDVLMDKYLIGYGMDKDDKNRGAPYIYFEGEPEDEDDNLFNKKYIQTPVQPRV